MHLVSFHEKCKMPKRVLGKTGKSLLLYKLQNSRDSGGVADSTQGSSMQ